MAESPPHSDESYIHTEHHYFQRVGWLRAAVLGANDGILSTAGVVPACRSLDAVSISMTEKEIEEHKKLLTPRPLS